MRSWLPDNRGVDRCFWVKFSCLILRQEGNAVPISEGSIGCRSRHDRLKDFVDSSRKCALKVDCVLMEKQAIRKQVIERCQAKTKDIVRDFACRDEALQVSERLRIRRTGQPAIQEIPRSNAVYDNFRMLFQLQHRLDQKVSV